MSDVEFVPGGCVYVGLKTDPEELLAIDREPTHFVRQHDGAVVLFDDDESVEIGRYKAFYIDVEGAMCAEESLFDIFDSRHQTLGYLELYNPGFGEFTEAAMKAAKADWLYEPNLLILDRLEILPRYRGHGYGLEALIGMMHWFQAGAGLVAMKPYPLQFEGGGPTPGEPDPMELAKLPIKEIAARTKLRRYYAQLGFRLVPKTPFMVRRVDQAPPKLPAARR